jgi:hypothetical protein
MSGFPIRPSRTAFGPEPKNRRPIVDPARTLDASVASLERWQVAGLGATSPLAFALCTVTGTAIALTTHGEAWNPNLALDGPTPVRVSAGVYTLTYAAQYPDKDGTLQTINIIAGVAAPQGLGGSGHLLGASFEKVDAHTAKVTLVRQDTGAVEDGSFFLALW